MPPPPVWLLDLDNTLHDAGQHVFPRINTAMTDYVARRLDLAPAAASELRIDYWRRYGATLLGMIRHHAIDPHEFLRETLPFPDLHRLVARDHHLRDTLRRLPGRKVVVTNGPRDYASAVLISQKMAAQFGWSEEQAVGKQIRVDTATFTVVGTLRNFHQQHLFEPIDPTMMRLGRSDRYFNLVVKAKPAELKAVHDRVKASWAQLYPLKPFHGYYQDEVGAEAYKVTSSIATIFSWFAIVAMMLTATGLFALVSLTVLKKMKEIALRKVVGAKDLQIMALVNRGYVWVFAIGAALGCWAGWFLTKLLMDLIFQINVGVEPITLVLGVAALFLISGLTVGFKVRQAVRTNPAEVLRSE